MRHYIQLKPLTSITWWKGTGFLSESFMWQAIPCSDSTGKEAVHHGTAVRLEIPDVMVS